MNKGITMSMYTLDRMYDIRVVVLEQSVGLERYQSCKLAKPTAVGFPFIVLQQTSIFDSSVHSRLMYI